MLSSAPSPSRRQVVASLLSLPLIRQAGFAQFSTSVKVINVLATVRDKDGKIVKGLTKDDFVLAEDGRGQTIQYFSQQSDLPLTLGLLIDTSGSERRNISTEKDASYKFLESVLRPDKDKAFLIHFDREVELLQDLTASRERLERALDQLQPSNPQQNAGNGNDPNSNGGNQGGSQGGGSGGKWGGGGIGIGFPGGGMGGGRGGMGGGGGRRGGGMGGNRGGGGTKFYDAVYLAADEILSKQKGRKAVIMLTDGEDNGSKETIDSAIHTAQQAEMLGYSIHIADSQSGFSSHGFGGGYGGGSNKPDGKKILKQISKSTGGGYFEFKKSLDDIYSQIDEELRNQYSIGYTPDKADNDGGFRKIELTVKQKGLVVQCRDGYYS